MELLTKWAFKNKLAIVVLVILSIILGVVSYVSIPMSYMPNAGETTISVTTISPTMDAKTITSNVTEPVEERLATLEGKVSVVSTTGDGFSQIIVSYIAGTDMKSAKEEIESKIAAIQLPQGVYPPVIAHLTTDMIPVVGVGLAFPEGNTEENLDWLQTEIIPVYQGISGIAGIQIFGMNQQQVLLQLDTVKMNELGVPIQAVTGVLQGKTNVMSTGNFTIDGKTSSIQVVGEIADLTEMNDWVITPEVKLGDIASVELSKDENAMTRVNGKESIALSFTKNSSSNTVTLSKDIAEKTDELVKKFDSRLEASIYFNSATFVENSVGGMVKEVLLGALFATLIILLFLRNWRTTLIAIVSIPLSLCMTVYLLAQSGISLNIMTLGGVAVAVGRLVDDSIVVIENIYRHIQKRGASLQVVSDAVREVASAITSSTFTTIAVFLPIGLVASLKELILPFALTVVYSLLASLIVAVTVVPLMSMGLLKKVKMVEHKSSTRYISALKWSLNHKIIVILTAAVLFFGSIGVYAVLPKGVANTSDSTMINVSFSLPGDTPAAQVRESVTQLESFIMAQPGTKNVYFTLGSNLENAQNGDVSSLTSVSYMVSLKENADANQLMDSIRTQQEVFQQATLDITVGLPGMNSGSVITLDLLGNNLDDLDQAASLVLDSMKSIEGVEKATSNQEEKKPNFEVRVDTSVANASDIGAQLALMLNRSPIGMVNSGGENYTLLLEAVQNPETESDILNLPIMTSQGVAKLESLAEIRKTEESTMIFHKDGKDFVRVSVQVEPSKVGDVNQEIKTKADGLSLPESVTLVIGGAGAQQSSDFNSLFMTMLTSIGIVFLILILTFKNFRAPFAILFSLPLAAIGAVLGLAISKIPVDTTTLVGALMLIGIVVTNAIVLLDRIKQNEFSMTVRESIMEAGATRLRPILMTALATVAAMTPLLFSNPEDGNIVSKSLSIVVIGGLVIATFLTVFVVPVVYELFYFRKGKQVSRDDSIQQEIQA
ncbi:efflux RND transporter permease subunit [Paenibacillus harenae]|uniref:efflux RND transporter permease subunit n=1 Tax=Paenibacillus harenae TaxID=306543 RepID=UPI0027D80539|nr:efflux RND transporter permease subunit [Paenibacillus harenae]